MTVFLDTVGLLAVWDESDQWHRAAQTSFSELLSGRADLVTSSFVLLECGNAAARRPYRSAVSRLRKQMEPGNRLIVPTVEDWQAAWLAYERGEADNAGIVDMFHSRLCGVWEYPKHLPTTGTFGRLDLRCCFRSLYIAFGYGLGFSGQKAVNHGKRRSREIPRKQKAIKRCQVGQKSGLELQNRCSAAELSWRFVHGKFTMFTRQNNAFRQRAKTGP